MTRPAPAIAAALVAAIAIGAISGCQPRQRYQPVPADSTAARGLDSLSMAMDAATKSWDSGSSEESARLSANVLAAALRPVPPEAWNDRARSLLDSLSIGAEIAAARGAILVNFFSRSDPERGSYPWLFWNTDKGTRFQAVEGRDLRLLELATRGGNVAPAGVAAVFARRAAMGGQPIAFVWKSGAGGAFSLAQTLGSDSLGGSGTAEFARADTTIELQSRTYRLPRGFTECSTCPHVYTLNRFLWTGSGFVRLSSYQVPSPYSTFVRFIGALQSNDRSAAYTELTDASLWDRARDLDWHQPRGVWRVAPTTDETAREMVFFRGERDAFRVHFESQLGDWKISSFEVASRSVE